MAMLAVAESVHPDEKAYLLGERNLPFPRRGWRRIQIVIVNRGDRLAEWRKDLGPAASFTAQPFDVPSLWEHTVGELWDIADLQRDQTTWTDFVAEREAESTLIADAIEVAEQRWKLAKERPVTLKAAFEAARRA